MVHQWIELEALELEMTAHQRSERASQYDDDHAHNSDASKLLNSLAAQLREIQPSPLINRYLAIHAFVFPEGPSNEGADTLAVIRGWDEYRARIGFDRYPASAEAYLTDLLAIVREVVPSASHLFT
jgi:hypothetical protein